MKYRIVVAGEMKRLEEGVEDMMSKGWVCQGGIVVENWLDGDDVMNQFYQAMVKEE